MVLSTYIFLLCGGKASVCTDSTAMLADFFKQWNDILSADSLLPALIVKHLLTVFYLICGGDSDHGASPQLQQSSTLPPYYPVVSPDCSKSWTPGVFNTWSCYQQPSIWWLQETHHKVILEMATWLGLIWNFQKQLLQRERCLGVWFLPPWFFAWFLGRQIAF